MEKEFGRLLQIALQLVCKSVSHQVRDENSSESRKGCSPGFEERASSVWALLRNVTQARARSLFKRVCCHVFVGCWRSLGAYCNLLTKSYCVWYVQTWDRNKFTWSQIVCGELSFCMCVWYTLTLEINLKMQLHCCLQPLPHKQIYWCPSRFLLEASYRDRMSGTI